MNLFKQLFFMLAAALLVQPLSAQNEATEAKAVRGAAITVTLKNIPSEDTASVNGDYNVDRGDGTIAMPYLKGRIKVDGMTARAIESSIRSRYLAEKIYSDPIVQVQVGNKGEMGVDTRFVMVSGYVGAKKNLPYREGISLIEALLECGDITDYGSRKIQITRGSVTRTYDYFSARDRNIKLQPNDVIHVPRRGAFEPRPDHIGP